MMRMTNIFIVLAISIGLGFAKRSLKSDLSSSSLQYHDDIWPKEDKAACSQSSKLKAMYGKMTFQPSLSVSPFVEMSVNVRIDDLQFAPHNTRKSGGFYIAYTTGMKGGPGGYLGIQMHKNGGQFLFSIWDADRWTGSGDNKAPKPSNKLTWPMHTNCKRNCQDCGMAHLKKWKAEGLTTGTQCSFRYPGMKIGDVFKVTLKKLKIKTINTQKNGGGMPVSHVKFGEVDRDITGAVWQVIVEHNGKRHIVGRIMFEGDGRGMHRLGTFDEMLGCNKCTNIYHKDTRYGLTVKDEAGDLRGAVKMAGTTKVNQSSCKKYLITGSKGDKSITFESGPLSNVDEGKEKVNLWEL